MNDCAPASHPQCGDRAASPDGAFSVSRDRRDYSWHVRYSVRRQEQQDAIIRKMLRESAAACFANQAGTGPRPLKQEVMTRWRGRHGLPAPAQPWAIFTAGCMGAGKTHVMQLLDKHGLLPLRSFVRIDLDRIRAQLPETKTYMRAPAPPAPQPASTHAGPGHRPLPSNVAERNALVDEIVALIQAQCLE